ncbi:hypothetical protein QT381_02015 [Galbitalea sp. SE-J8]|uniref:hypothetical protein n=1 Tax=Galbitalea sp. SE-J8 TaxID=3054952 RepID=UPI00259C9304|nr:hypothetical protein [Galbitalea sp. SE-J8]MDM4761779.1 hypothetical protein [Galbitalea sp. SE-J8]
MTRPRRTLNWRRRVRDESSHRPRAPHGAEFFRGRRVVDGVGVFVTRFPGSGGAETFVRVHGIGVSSRCLRPHVVMQTAPAESAAAIVSGGAAR